MLERAIGRQPWLLWELSVASAFRLTWRLLISSSIDKEVWQRVAPHTPNGSFNEFDFESKLAQFLMGQSFRAAARRLLIRLRPRMAMKCRRTDGASHTLTTEMSPQVGILPRITIPLQMQATPYRHTLWLTLGFCPGS